jgi:hypothetical protein
MAPKQKRDKEIAGIQAMLGDDVSAAQIDAVLAAQAALVEGDPVGTVRREEDSGMVAHRVNDGGVVQWRVTGPDGECFNDLQTTLPWPVIYAVES